MLQVRCTNMCQGAVFKGDKCPGTFVKVHMCECGHLSGCTFVRVYICPGEHFSGWTFVKVGICQGQHLSGWPFVWWDFVIVDICQDRHLLQLPFVRVYIYQGGNFSFKVFIHLYPCISSPVSAGRLTLGSFYDKCISGTHSSSNKSFKVHWKQVGKH